MTNSFPRKFNYDPITNPALDVQHNIPDRRQPDKSGVSEGKKATPPAEGKPAGAGAAAFVGKIKKSEEIRRPAALTFSGG